jgi:hypothetical protein
LQKETIHTSSGRENVVYGESAAAGAMHASAIAFRSILNPDGSHRVAGQSPSRKFMAVAG